MDGKINIASVGTSSIMRTIQEAIRLTPGLQTKVIYSRDPGRGRRFASEMGVEAWCDDYEALTGREDVDVIYIASPNRFHVPQALQAMRRGKHVIIEKPAAVRARDAAALTEAARENHVFFMEAITTLFMPNYLAFREALAGIGRIRRAEFSFGRRSSKYDAYLRGENPNIFNPQMDAGALNDMGIYSIHTAVGLFGKPRGVSYEPETGENGIDLAGVLRLEYPGFSCRITTAKCRDIPCFCRIEGEHGWLMQEGMQNSFEGCSVSLDGRRRTIDRQEPGNRMVYELARFRDALLSTDLEFFARMSRQTGTAAWVLEQAHACAQSANTPQN